MNNMKDLIRDSGKIRNCPANVVKMGYWRTLWEFHGYANTLKGLFSYYFWDALATVIATAIAFPFLPILPFVECYSKMRRDKKYIDELKKETK